MEEKPLLQFYTDETWGYNCWDEKKKKQDGIEVKFQQEEGESRGAFFKRVNLAPKAKMYGSILKKDRKCNTRDWVVRFRVAEQGYGLDILVHDEDWRIRTAVANRGCGLDVLVHDENEYVRAAVAYQGYGRDILVYDKSVEVRLTVAHKGYGLGILVHDEDWNVREAVAEKGYGLDILVHDGSLCVRKAAEVYLYEKGYPSIETWIEVNPKKCADRKNRK